MTRAAPHPRGSVLPPPRTRAPAMPSPKSATSRRKRLAPQGLTGNAPPRLGGPGGADGSHAPSPSSKPVLQRRDEPLGVEGRGAAGAGGGDGLPIRVVDDVAGGEHALDVGAGARRGDLHVALVVELDLPAEQLAT